MSNTKEVSKIEFDEWVSKMIRDCMHNTGIHDDAIKEIASYPYVEQHKRLFWNMNFIYTSKGQKGTALEHHQFMVYISEDGNYLRITNVINGKSGYSKKNTGDKFDAKIALAIAWARYCKNDIPIQENTLTMDQFKNLKSGTIIYDTLCGTKMKVVGVDPMNNENMIVWTFDECDGSRCHLESIFPQEGKYIFECKSLFRRDD